MITFSNISLQLHGILARSRANSALGALTLRKDALKRIDTPTGYFGVGRMHYYVKDYQGNIRQVTDADGNVEQDNHYYPYGMLIAESSDILAGNSSSNANPYLYGSKEYLTTAGANLLDFTARTYDPSTILFQTQDPLSGKYTPFLPYLYCGADPVNRIDPDGRKINMLSLKLSDETLGYETTSKVLSDLNSQTGLSLSLDEEGMLQYAKDDDGKPIVSTITDEKGNSVQSGSKTARNFLMKAINHKDVVNVGFGLESKTDGPENAIGLNFPQIQGMIEEAHEVDGNTLGFGMTFLHELHHTKVGGGYTDDKNIWGTGDVVTNMNRIRTELNKQGFNYGIRTNYTPIPTPQGLVVPFNDSALWSLKNCMPMGRRDKYILIKLIEKTK